MKPKAALVDDAESRPWLATALVAVPASGCVWPIGEIDDESGFRFCCEPVEASSAHVCRSYCAKHLAVAYLRNGETQEDRDANGVTP